MQIPCFSLSKSFVTVYYVKEEKQATAKRRKKQRIVCRPLVSKFSKFFSSRAYHTSSYSLFLHCLSRSHLFLTVFCFLTVFHVWTMLCFLTVFCLEHIIFQFQHWYQLFSPLSFSECFQLSHTVFSFFRERSPLWTLNQYESGPAGPSRPQG